SLQRFQTRSYRQMWRRSASRRAEGAHVDSRRYHVHTVGRRCQPFDRRRGFCMADGEDRLGVLRKMRFTTAAAGPFGGFSLGEGTAIVGGNGVEALHVRDAMFGRQWLGGHSGEPVVGVHQVGAAPMLFKLVGERADEVLVGALIGGRGWACVELTDPDTAG